MTLLKSRRRPPQIDSAPEQQKKPSKPLVPLWVWWLLLLATLVWNLVLLRPDSEPKAQLTYTDFMAEVRGDRVASVTIKEQHVDGVFKRPTTWSRGTEGTGAHVYLDFATTIPSFPDDRLLPALEQHGVVVTVEELSGPSLLLRVLLNMLPMVLLFGLLLLISRRMMGGGGLGRSKARLYSHERPGVTFVDVAGADDAKAELQEIVSFLKAPERFRTLGARLPRGVLLAGPPGTGKTLLARAVAGEAGVPFFSISASEFVEMFVGVGASRVRDLFGKAKKAAPAIIFVDEIDAVGRHRGGGQGGNDEREQTLNQLLVEMDGFDEETRLVVIAATNRPDVLDHALRRPGRFDRQVTVGLPDREGREAILAVHTRPLRLNDEVKLTLLARRTPGFAGADLANLANEAALAAARRAGDNVRASDFEEALDRIILGTRQAGLIGDEDRRTVAYHEGGHALVAKLTPGADPVDKVTIIPHGRALGVTQQLPEDDRRNYTRDYLLTRLTVMMGGRAAENLVLGQPTTGAENDILQATRLARHMTMRWGMSPEMGPVAYHLGDDNPFLSGGAEGGRAHAEATAACVDQAVRRLLDEAYARAHELLEQHRSSLDTLAEELIACETVDALRLSALLAMDAERAGDRRAEMTDAA
jgi:cell division protease FtsH